MEGNERKLHDFLHSYDFMKLGQAVNHGNWQMAAMISQRMSSTARELGLDTFERNLTGLRQSINRKNVVDAKQNLAMITSKRVQMLNLEQDK